jgi:hypothetical protein
LYNDIRHDYVTQSLPIEALLVASMISTRDNGGLRRYVMAATASRTADEGMAPALALVVAATGRQPALAGVLVAAVGFPHVLAGPLAGAALDASRHRRALLALAPAVVGAALAGIALALGHLPDVLCVALAALAGCFGPLLTGGLSAQLTQLDSAGGALALDGATYNVAGIAGPAVVAAGAALTGAVPAALCLAALAVGAAGAVLTLPAGCTPTERGGLRCGIGGAARLWRARTLRGVTAGTTLAFLGAGALPVLVIARADELGSPTTGAALMALMAAGALAGALLLARRASDGGRPERRVMLALGAVGVALAAGAVGPGLVALGAGLALAGIADGVLLPATLAVRAGQSRPDERGAVFTTAASLKIAAGAAGAALGGLLAAAAGATAALLAVAALQLAGAAVCAALARPAAADGA